MLPFIPGSAIIYKQKRQLNYPLHPLHYQTVKKPLNVLIIAIDTWRFDTFNSQITPNMYRFATKSWQFMNHYSGGNATQPGIFSLFYGLPGQYWMAMLRHHRGPVLIHQLLKQQYQMGVFSSASLDFPTFDQTVFREVPDLRIETPGSDSVEQDRYITKEFLQFLQERNLKKPFFSFLFFDTAHNYCETFPDYPQPFQPAVKQCNRLLLSGDWYNYQ